MNPEYQWIGEVLRRSVAVSDEAIDWWVDRLPELLAQHNAEAFERNVELLKAQSPNVADADNAAPALVAIAQFATSSKHRDYDAAIGRIRNDLALEPDLQPQFERLTQRIRPHWTGLRKAVAVRRAKAGVLPTIDSLSATYELRAICDLPTRNVSEKPEIIGLQPVASIRLALDSGEPDTIYFQCSRDDLTMLESEIQTAIAMLDGLETKYGE